MRHFSSSLNKYFFLLEIGCVNRGSGGKLEVECVSSVLSISISVL